MPASRYEILYRTRGLCQEVQELQAVRIGQRADQTGKQAEQPVFGVPFVLHGLAHSIQ